MAGLIDPTDITKARQSGYSDAEISGFLSEKHPEQFKAAREAGYNDHEILAHLSGDAEKPSGPGAGAAQGISQGAAGLASTLGLMGIKSDTLDNVAKHAAPDNYKAAPLIREGGHFYNPSDWQPGNIPQFAAEMAPGLATDIAAAKVGAGIGGVAGVRGKLIGGLAGGLGSAALRTFGPGAHENAAARTGDANAPVTGSDIGREAIKQALMAVPNAAGLSRFLPGVGGSALAKYMTTIGTEGAAGGARDAIGQLGTSVGQEHGKEYDPNQTASSVAGGAVLGGTLAAPKLASDTASNIHFRNSERTPEGKAGSEALATRLLNEAGGKPLVSTLGNTEHGANTVNNVHAAVHRELADASKGETLSTDAANTLADINAGRKVSDKSLSALSDEASTSTMDLAHQALASARLRAMGHLTDKKFTGGLSGSMESLAPISNPVKTLGAAGLVAAGAGHAAGLGLLGTYGLPVIGAIGGTYLGARALDKMTGLRSPVKGFTDRYGGTDTPIRAPEVAQPPPLPEEAPQPTLRATLNTNAKLEEGMAQIAKKLGAERRKSLLNDPMSMLKQLAATRTPEAADVPAQEKQPWAAPTVGELWNGPSPIAKSMLGVRLKAGLPPETPAAPPEPAAPPPPVVISPIARKMLDQKMKQGLPPEPVPAPEPAPAPPAPPEAPNLSPVAMKMLGVRIKAGLPPEPAPAAPQVPEAPQINPTALAMVQKKMKQGLPDAPASPAIAAAMQTVAAHAAPTAPPAPPVISKIMKKAGKPVEAQQAPEEDQPYTPIPEEDLVRKHLLPPAGKTQDEMVADHELNSYGPVVREKYGKNVIAKREGIRDFAESIANDHTPADAQAAADMYHQLDHISRRKEAAKAIRHYTAHMTAEAANAVNAHFTPKVMKAMWKSE